MASFVMQGCSHAACGYGKYLQYNWWLSLHAGCLRMASFCTTILLSTESVNIAGFVPLLSTYKCSSIRMVTVVIHYKWDKKQSTFNKISPQ
jgi:hypothetical protein